MRFYLILEVNILSSPLELIEDQILETISMMEVSKKELEDLGIKPSIIEIQLNSLRKRLESLEREKRQIEDFIDKDEIIITIMPSDLPSGQVSLRDFSLVTGGLQSISDSIANTHSNQPSSQGKIPNRVLQQNQLILKETLAGSFKAILEIKHPRQSAFDEPITTRTMTDLFMLFESSSIPERLAEVISRLGPRTLQSYKVWAKGIKEMDSPIKLEHYSAFNETTEIYIDNNRAKRMYENLSNTIQTSEERISVLGKLTGANIRTKTFEIITQTDEKITGVLGSSTIAEISNKGLDFNCKAELIKITVKGLGIKDKATYTLNSIEIEE